MTSLARSAAADIVIPARYASSRYPGKPLASLRGADGVSRTLIAHSIAAARAVRTEGTVYVATDDERVAAAARAEACAVIMTSPECRNGTERVGEAVRSLPHASGFVINFQGDALLTPPDLVEALIAHMTERPDCRVATIAVRCSPQAYRQLVADQRAGRSGGTTVVTDRAGRALYFSKNILPYGVVLDEAAATAPVLLHLGLYAYRRESLERYRAAPVAAAEQLEGLEQLRFLVEGEPIEVVVADPPGWDVIELNNPSDVPLIEAIFRARGMR